MLSSITFQAASRPTPPPPTQPRTLREMGAVMSPIDKNLILLPADKPAKNLKPVSSSRAATYTIGGSLAGALGGIYASMFLSTALAGGVGAVAALSLMGGCTVVGGLMGFLASK